MSDGTPPPAPHIVVAIDDNARWLLPLERAPPPSRNEGCILLRLSDPAPLQSNGSSPPSPLIMSPPSSHKSSTAATLPTQTVPPPDRDTASLDASSNALSERMNASLCWLMEEINEASRRVTEDLQRRCDERIRRCDERIRQLDERREAFLRIKAVNDACAAPLDAILAEIAHDETVHEASRLSTTTAPSSPPSANKKTTPSPTSTETTSSYSTPPRPTSSSMSKYTPLTGGDPSTLTPALNASSSTRTSTAITPSPMARRRNRPRRRPGRRHRPRAPEAIPSHPIPTTEGTPVPTTTHLSSARATAICRSTSPHTVTVPPSHHPFIIRQHTGAGDVVSTGGSNDFFRDCGERKRPRRRSLARRVCRRHGPRAPSPLVSLCGRRHRPRAPSFPEAF